MVDAALLTTNDLQSNAHKPSASRITFLASSLDSRLTRAIERIAHLNSETKFISINAKMEAMRTGGVAGRAFGVVAQAIQAISNQTADVAKSLAEETHQTVLELRRVNEALSTSVQGERLADLALANIDLVDRNLYERTCDVRWWATDSSVVTACSEPTPGNLRFVTKRLGQILDAYTVYFDIVLTDTDGRVIANGRPELFHSVGTVHGDKPWFRTAASSKSGMEFGFRSVSPSTLVNGQRVLVYSAAVRQGGDLQGAVIGVLAVVFRWDALGQTIVERTPLAEAEKAGARVVLIESDGRVLADTDRQIGEMLSTSQIAGLLRESRGYAVLGTGEGRCLVGHARSPGYETYATGWHSLIYKPVD